MSDHLNYTEITMTKKKKQEESILSDEDWGILLPGQEILLGNTAITIRPLNIKDFSSLTSKVTSVVTRIKDRDITMSTLNKGNNFESVIRIIVKDAPEILTILSGIPVRDIIRLPLNKNIEIAARAWEINLADQEALSKNLQSVANMIQQLTGMLGQAVPAQDSETQSNS